MFWQLNHWKSFKILHDIWHLYCLSTAESLQAPIPSSQTVFLCDELHQDIFQMMSLVVCVLYHYCFWFQSLMSSMMSPSSVRDRADLSKSAEMMVCTFAQILIKLSLLVSVSLELSKRSPREFGLSFHKKYTHVQSFQTWTFSVLVTVLSIDQTFT